MNLLLRSIAWWANEVADTLWPVETPFEKLAETAPEGEPTAEWPDDLWAAEQRAQTEYPLDDDEIAAMRIMIEERFGRDSDSSTEEPTHAVPPLFPAHLREAGRAIRSWLAGEPPPRVLGDRAYWLNVADDLIDVAASPDAAEIFLPSPKSLARQSKTPLW